MKIRNPVAKHQPEFCKARVFRDRKKEEKAGRVKREHPKHEPYVRGYVSLHNLLLEDDAE